MAITRRHLALTLSSGMRIDIKLGEGRDEILIAPGSESGSEPRRKDVLQFHTIKELADFTADLSDILDMLTTESKNALDDEGTE